MALPLLTNAQRRQYWGYCVADVMVGADGASSCMVGAPGPPRGDSGGPLLCQKDDAWILAGIVSWGSSTSDPSVPGVYARITELLNRIDSILVAN